MNNLKEKLNNYPYMDYPTFKFIKEEILKLSDRNIMDLHDHMDIITENEGEFSADIDTEEDWRDYQRRVNGCSPDLRLDCRRGWRTRRC